MCYIMVIQQVTRHLDPDGRTVGVRELRQNLSVYLDRVKVGETLKVTERGHVVAILAPLPANRLTTLERLVAEGRATAPSRPLSDLQLPKPGRPGAPPSEQVLDELGEDRM